MKFLNSSGSIEHAFKKLLNKYQHVAFAVAWASHDFPIYDELIINQRKIKRAIVGTHFYQTHPNFIAHFIKDRRVKFVKQTGGVFHPKFYLFENSVSDWACILGSANFTKAAFSKNQEACVVFGSVEDTDGALRSRVDQSLDGYWAAAKYFNEAELDRYRILSEMFRSKLKPVAGDFGSGKEGTPILQTPLLNWSWKQFLTEVRRDPLHRLKGRVNVLSEARQLFEKKVHFVNMTANERKGIAGFSSDPNVQWGWFGSMKGAGRFTNRVNQNDPNLSRALDAIPLLGEVRREQYLAYIELYQKAFPKNRGHGLGTATRLLAMKRPDYFVCFDSANRKQLCDAFGISVPQHDYEKYWDAIIARIIQSRWWNSPAPDGETVMKIWAGRAAFLDSIFYTG